MQVSLLQLHRASLGMEGVLLWLRRGQPRVPDSQHRAQLEEWVRLRFQLAGSDPMTAIIGAVARLTDAGITANDALDTVLRIMHEADSRTS